MAHLAIGIALFFLFFDFPQCYKLNLPKPNISPECELKGICDSVENYPTNLVNELIEMIKRQNGTFYNDDAPQPSNHTSDEEPLKLCNSTPEFVVAKAALDINGNWQYIINNSEKPVQVFRTEICRPKIDSCSDNIVFGLGYEGKCIQKKSLRTMLYVNEANGVGIEYFNVPTCCSCSLIMTDNKK